MPSLTCDKYQRLEACLLPLLYMDWSCVPLKHNELYVDWSCVPFFDCNTIFFIVFFRNVSFQRYTTLILVQLIVYPGYTTLIYVHLIRDRKLPNHNLLQCSMILRTILWFLTWEIFVIIIIVISLHSQEVRFFSSDLPASGIPRYRVSGILIKSSNPAKETLNRLFCRVFIHTHILFKTWLY